MVLSQLLSADGYIACHESVIKKIGLVEAAVLGTLYSYTSELGFTEFHVPLRTLCSDLNLSQYRINNALVKLQDNGLVRITKKGIPQKNVYTLILDVFTEE